MNEEKNKGEKEYTDNELEEANGGVIYKFGKSWVARGPQAGKAFKTKQEAIDYAKSKGWTIRNSGWGGFF